LLMNSFKYVADKQPCNIAINIVEKGNIINITYEDNGPGLPDGVSLDNANTTGLRLIKRLAKQAKITPTVLNNSGKLLFILSFNKD
jgi:two-component sensor histidine kinase